MKPLFGAILAILKCKMLEVGHVQREQLLSVYLIMFICPQEILYLSTGHIFLFPKRVIYWK